MDNTLLIIGLANRGGGSQTFLVNLIKQFLTLEQSIWKVVALLPNTWRSERIVGENYEAIYVDDYVFSSALNRIKYENISLPKIIKQYKPDLLFFSSEIIPFRVRNEKIPIVINYHATLQLNRRYISFTKPREIYNYVERIKSLKRADNIVFVSNHSKAEILFKYSNIDERKVSVVYHGVERFPKAISKDNREYEYILTVGDRYKHKNYDRLIRIYADLVNNNTLDIHLVIVGRIKDLKYDLYLEEIAKDCGVEDKVHFQDYLNQDGISSLYQNASLYVTLSSVESFGLTPLEAMSHGVPVIMNMESALPEIYGHYSGFVDIYKQKEDEIADILFKALNHAQYRDILSEEGKRLVDYYTWEKCAEAFADIFRSLIIDER